MSHLVPLLEINQGGLARLLRLVPRAPATIPAGIPVDRRPTYHPSGPQPESLDHREAPLRYLPDSRDGRPNVAASMRHAVVSEALKGIRRTIGTAQKGKSPLLTLDLQKILVHLG